MDKSFEYDVFLSHAGKDTAWCERLAERLRDEGVQVWFDKWCLLPGHNIDERINDGLEKSRRLVAVWSEHYFANEKVWTLAETYAKQHRDVLGRERLLIPLLRRDCKIKPTLQGLFYIDCRNDADFELQFRQLVEALGLHRSPRQVTESLYRSSMAGAGIAPRDAVFDEGNPLPGKVFAIELLRAPVCLKRLNQRTFVSISRAGVELAVYTVPGRQHVVDQTFAGSEAVKEAKELDEQVHRILLGRKAPEEYQLHQPNLRWASGGVLSRVQYRRHTWFSFFFRDIPPYGWNITLGASEHDDELTDPWKFLMREFLEETLVCHRPANAPGTIRRPLVFNERITVDEQIRQAERLSAKHRRLRFERDRINFRQLPGDLVFCDIWPTRTEIDIDGSQPMRNVLICINLTELGIEVLKVLSYDLDDDDFLLDGEILEPAGRNQVELVRMPVALISEDYLRRAFAGRERFAFCCPCDARLPSIEGPPIPESQIVIFPHDVRRRAELARDEEGRATAWEKERYALWIDRFGGNFLKGGKPTTANASSLFTPTSAKAMAYYFANA